MQCTSRVREFTLAAAALLCFAAAPAGDGASAQSAPGRTVEIKVVNYKQLGDAVKQHKGKVVVVDLWGIT